MVGKNCSINSPDLSSMETVALPQRVNDYQEAVELAGEQAGKRFKEYMLISWYDADRDFESPPNSTECARDGRKDGYIHYGLSHGAKLKVDIENGRFIFFFTPVEW
ncbi:AF1514 family protein [Desulfobacterota bacterium M19]